METTQYNNGPRGTENPSTQDKLTIQTPDNGSYQQSLYIAAILRFIGCEGLASPATDVRDGIAYTFDFYHRECGKVFKVLESADLAEYDKYVQYPGEIIVIVNVDDDPRCEAGKCACCGDRYVTLPRALGEKLHDADATYVYFQHHLCEYIGDEKDGTSQWVVLDPIVLRIDEDEESDGNGEGNED